MGSLVVFTKNNEFLVASVRKIIYVWDSLVGNLVKQLNAHFGRIVSLLAVTSDGSNKLVSSSIDRTIKVSISVP